MFLFIFQYLFIPLILTIIIELGAWKFISFIFKNYEFHFFWLSIVAINIATNPLINFIVLTFDPTRSLFVMEIALELLVILIEAGLLYIIYKKNFSQLILISLIINIISYGVGLSLFKPSWA